MNAAQTINRAIHDAKNPYVMARRGTVQDDSLSYEAAGLLVLLLSKPDDWIIKAQTLVREGCNIKKVYRLFTELIDAGYMKRDALRNKQGHFKEWTYQVFEEPQAKEGDHPFGQKSTHGLIHLVDNPPGGKTAHVLNKDKALKTEKPETEQIPVANPEPVTPVSVVTVPEQNAVVRVYVPVTTYEQAKAEASPEAVAMAEAAMARLQASKPPDDTPITPDGIKAGAAFKAQFDQLDADIQSQLQKLVNKFGVYAVTETIRQINRQGVNKPMGLLIWKLEDAARKGTLPKLMPYSPTTATPNAAEPVKLHWKHTQKSDDEPVIMTTERIDHFKSEINQRRERERMTEYGIRNTV